MKRIIALILVAIIIFMCSCDLAVQNESDTDADVRESASDYIIMPISKVKIKLEEKYHDFIPYITEELLEAAEKDIVAKKGKVEPRYCTFFTTNEGYLHIQEEYIRMVDPEAIANGYEQVPPCGDHWHSGCGGRISSQPLEKFIVKSKPTNNDIITISDAVELIIATSKDPIESVPETDSEGNINENAPSELPPVEQLRRADLTKINKKYISFAQKTEAVIMFTAKSEERLERCVIITPEVIIVVGTWFGHPRQFSFLNSRAVNDIWGIRIISPKDYQRCMAHKEVLDAIKEANPESVPPETDFSEGVYFGYMTIDSFEVYSQKTLEKIFAENGYEDNGLSAFAETFERFGIDP